MKKDLCVSLHTLVELLVRVWSFVQRNIVRNDKGWFSTSRYDQVSEVAIVRLGNQYMAVMVFELSGSVYITHLDVTLACTYGETFLKELACVQEVSRTVSHEKATV